MYHIIINPRSRSGRGGRIWREIRRRLLLLAVPFQEYPTTCRGSARETAARLTGEGRWKPEDVLLVIGGDGTVNEAVDGICHPSEVRFGYIPTGSGNDFARGTGIPQEPVQALEAILCGGEKSINIGRIECAEGRSRRFLISSGIGFDAGICHEALASRIKDTLNTLHLGKLTYAIIALKQLFALQPFSLELQREDGTVSAYRQVLFAVAMNLPYEGGGFRFCPEADPSDGMLDVMIVSEMAKWKAGYLLPLALAGKHTGFPEVHMERCRCAVLRTDHQEPVHLDGESGGRQRWIRAEVEGERIRLLGDWK